MRTNEQHRYDCEMLVDRVYKQILGGQDRVVVQIRGGSTIEFCQGLGVLANVAPEDGPKLTLYWLIYGAVDAALRETDPIDEESSTGR